MNIDLSFINQNRIAVHTKKRSDAVKLVESIREIYPSCISQEDADIMIGSWSRYKENTAYRFNHYTSTDLGSGKISKGYCYTEWYKEESYTVIEFEDLITDNDLGEICFEFSSKTNALSFLF